jgi:hypothetical protein
MILCYSRSSAISRAEPSFPRSAWECRPGRSASLSPGAAERRRPHSHAERGNEVNGRVPRGTRRHGCHGSSFPRSAWECRPGRSASLTPRRRGAAKTAFPRGTWERGDSLVTAEMRGVRRAVRCGSPGVVRTTRTAAPISQAFGDGIHGPRRGNAVRDAPRPRPRSPRRTARSGRRPADAARQHGRPPATPRGVIGGGRLDGKRPPVKIASFSAMPLVCPEPAADGSAGHLRGPQ